MMKVVGVLAFAVMMLVAGVTEVPAVAFNSAGGQGSCAGTAAPPGPSPATCGGGWVAVAPDPRRAQRRGIGRQGVLARAGTVDLALQPARVGRRGGGGGEGGPQRHGHGQDGRERGNTGSEAARADHGVAACGVSCRARAVRYSTGIAWRLAPRKSVVPPPARADARTIRRAAPYPPPDGRHKGRAGLWNLRFRAAGRPARPCSARGTSRPRWPVGSRSPGGPGSRSSPGSPGRGRWAARRRGRGRRGTAR